MSQGLIVLNTPLASSCGGVGGWGGMGWGVRGEQERDLEYMAMSTVEGLHTAVGHTHTHTHKVLQ